MANDRLYIGNRETKEHVFVDKGWGCGWDGGHFDAEKIQEFLRGTVQDGNGGKPTVLEFFSEKSKCCEDYLQNGQMLVRGENGGFEWQTEEDRNKKRAEKLAAKKKD